MDTISTATTKQLGNAAFDQSDVHRCREFLKKYGLKKARVSEPPCARIDLQAVAKKLGGTIETRSAKE
jgi:hypothetical protein